MRRLPITILLAATLAQPALAQDGDEIPGLQTDGSVVFTVSGTGYSYHTVSFLYDTVRTGSASVTQGEFGLPDLLMVTGVSNPDGAGNEFHLILGFKDEPGNRAPMPTMEPPSLIWFPAAGSDAPFWATVSAGEDMPDITVTRYEFDGKTGHVTGSFAGQLCFVPDLQAEEPDAGNCQAVTGTFDTAIYRSF